MRRDGGSTCHILSPKRWTGEYYQSPGFGPLEARGAVSDQVISESHEGTSVLESWTLVRRLGRCVTVSG